MGHDHEELLKANFLKGAHLVFMLVPGRHRQREWKSSKKFLSSYTFLNLHQPQHLLKFSKLEIHSIVFPENVGLCY